MEGIEAARGIAATMVVVYHAASHLFQNFHVKPAFFGLGVFGHAGVDFFFVLSGFIILFVHEKDLGVPGRLSVYLERRLTRIYPLYLAVLCFTIGLIVMGGHHELPGPVRIVANALLVPLNSQPIVGVSWTLQHEMLFYILFALGIANVRLGSVALLIWAAIIVSATLVGGAGDQGAFGVVASPFNLQFFMGMSAAYAVRRYALPNGGLIATVGAVAFLAIGMAEWGGALDGFGSMARILYGLAGTGIVIGLAAREIERERLLPAALKVLGKSSYSIYLVHEIGIGVAYKMFGAVGLLALLPIEATHVGLIVAGVGLGIAVSYAIEYPLMNGLRASLALMRLRLSRRGAN